MDLKNRLLVQPGFVQVMKKWLATGRILKRAREEVGGFLEQKITNKDFCRFCQSRWGLRCDSIQSFDQQVREFVEYRRKNVKLNLKGKRLMKLRNKKP